MGTSGSSWPAARCQGAEWTGGITTTGTTDYLPGAGIDATVPVLMTASEAGIIAAGCTYAAGLREGKPPEQS